MNSGYNHFNQYTAHSINGSKNQTRPVNPLNNFDYFGPCRLTHSFANERRVKELENDLLYVDFRVSLQYF